MNGAHTGEPTGGNCPWLVFLIDAGTAYCVPEAGINYKRQMKTQINAGNSCEFPGDELRKRAPVI
jgi:hypothetical protein